MREPFVSLDPQSSNDATHPKTACLPRTACLPANESATDTASWESSFNDSVSYSRDGVIDWLKKSVSNARLQHILRVEAMATRLAHHHGLDEHRAATAGLMHDLAKSFKPARLLDLAQTHGIELDSVMQANPHLLHAEVGAIVAQEKFGIKHEGILQAIRNHTLGFPGMDSLSCVVFLADSLEPGRGETLELEQLRQASWRNLYEAVWLTCNYSLNYLLSTRCAIHPRMVLTRNWAMEVSSKCP